MTLNISQQKVLIMQILFYLIFNNVDVYIEENNENKYLIFASKDKNKETLENYRELWNEVKNQIELISGNKPIESKKDFMKIKFESDDGLPLGKIFSIPGCAIATGSVFQEINNTHKFIYMNVCMSMSINFYSTECNSIV